MKNTITISGHVANKDYLNKRFNKIIVDVRRTSGNVDSLPVLVDSDLIVNIGDYIKVTGELKTYDDKYSTDNKLKSYIRAETIDFSEENDNDVNLVELEGIIVKSPVFRITATGRRIARFVIANNCPDANYIPCICWGYNAMIDYAKGDYVTVSGRYQSRIYIKEEKSKTAYEVSLNMITVNPLSTNYQHDKSGNVGISTFEY